LSFQAWVEGLTACCAETGTARLALLIQPMLPGRETTPGWHVIAFQLVSRRWPTITVFLQTLFLQTHETVQGGARASGSVPCLPPEALCGQGPSALSTPGSLFLSMQSNDKSHFPCHKSALSAASKRPATHFHGALVIPRGRVAPGF